MKEIKNVFRFLANTIFYCAFAIIMVVLLITVCGIKPYITMSGSMEPNVKTGSICFVNTNADYDDILVGDVIAFETPTGGMVTHRVISITEEGMETQGDANDVSDGISTTRENFAGKNIFSVPYAGYVFAYLQQPKRCANLLIISVALIMWGMIDGQVKMKTMKNA